MRLFLVAPIFAALAAALPAPVPQDIDIGMVLAAPDPTYSEAVGVTAQAVTYDPTSIAAQITPVITAGADDSNNLEARNVKRTACAPQPTGVANYAVSVDTASSFLTNNTFASLALTAPVPSGYTNTFSNLNASNSAYGYLGFTTLSSYDTNLCASKCNAINGCLSFNLYFERDPSVDPGSGSSSCQNPSSVTMVKCVFWGGPVYASNANNYGQWRNQFQVVIAGSNGYLNNTLASPQGYYNPIYLGNKAISAPLDHQSYNTSMGSTIFTNGPFNAPLCASFCDTQSAYNLANPPADGSSAKVCRFFNTFLLYVNTTAHMKGQYCQLYTEAWDSSYATNNGQWSGSDHYLIQYSFSYTNTTSAGYDPTTGDKRGAVYQAAAEISSASLQPFCSSQLGYVVSTITSTSTFTSTPIVSATVTKTVATITGSQFWKRDQDEATPTEVNPFAIPTSLLLYPSGIPTDYPSTSNASDIQKRAAIITPDVLTKYPASIVISACSLQASAPTSTSTVVSTKTVTAKTSTIYSIIPATASAQPQFALQITSGTLSGQYLTVVKQQYYPNGPVIGVSATTKSAFSFDPSNGGLYVPSVPGHLWMDALHRDGGLPIGSNQWASNYPTAVIAPCSMNTQGLLTCGSGDYSNFWSAGGYLSLTSKADVSKYYAAGSFNIASIKVVSL